MRLLRCVGPDDSGEHVIVETTDGSERFSLRVDDALRGAVRADLPRLIAPEPVVETVAEPAIGPREIQMRVRSGEAPEALAQATGMKLERVLRFAGPVLDERARIADEARRARARRSAEGQLVVFGEAVEERFAAHGIDPSTVRWDARRRDDGQWIVSAHWVGGELDRTAEWVFHLNARHVTPIDDTAADLLSDRAIRPVVPVPERPARPSLSVAPPLLPGVVAFPAMPDAHTGPLPRREDVFDQEAPDRDSARRTAAATATASASASASVAEPTDEPEYDDAQLPLAGLPSVAPKARAHVTNLGVAHRDDESEDDRAARARIPSWDDILLGVRRKGEHPSH